MAWSGTKSGVTRLDPAFQVAYWVIFLLVLLLAIYVALLDLRYVRMQYSQGEKDLFEDTLGSEEFRTALRDASSAPSDQQDSSPRDN